MQRLVLLLLALLVTACSSRQVAPTPTPTATREAVKPAYTPRVTPPPEQLTLPTITATTLVVGNTGGDGVWLRRSPAMADRLRAWPDGTAMVVVGEDREAEGRVWKNVKDPAGNVGWIPAEYLVRPTATQAAGATGTPQAAQKQDGCLRPTPSFAEHLAGGLSFPGGAVAGAQAIGVGLATSDGKPIYLVGAAIFRPQGGEEAIALWATNADPTVDGSLRGAALAAVNTAAKDAAVWPLDANLAALFTPASPEVQRLTACVKEATGR